MAGQRDRRVTVHLPESAGVHTVFEFTSAHRHLFGKLAIARRHFAIDEHGVVVGDFGIAARLGNRQTNLRSGSESPIPHVFLLGHVKQRATGQRHGVDRHAHVGAASAHGRSAVLVRDHLDAGTPVQPLLRLILGHALDRHVNVDMAETSHLFGDGRGFPFKLSGQ